MWSCLTVFYLTFYIEQYNCQDTGKTYFIPESSHKTFRVKFISLNKRYSDILFRVSDIVKRLDKEIKNILKDKPKKESSKKEVEEAIKQLEEEVLKLKEIGKGSKPSEDIQKPNDKEKSEKKCKYFNVGYCKYNEKCRFIHPKEICEKYPEGKCNGSNCLDRHPKPCKWFKGLTGCRRKEACHFSHDTLVCDGQGNKAQKNEISNFNCVSCKYEWKDRSCVVKHCVNTMEVYFCLNCDDWVQDKSKVLDNGWSLFDQYGNPSKLV